MKVTEKALSDAVMGANRQSKHLQHGLQLDQNGKGYIVRLVWRVNGASLCCMSEMSAREAKAAIDMYHIMAMASKPEANND
jgi:hypothetical protein